MIISNIKILKVLLIACLIGIFVNPVFAEGVIKKYSEKLFLKSDGSIKGEVEFVIKEDTSASLLLPLNFEKGFSLTSNDDKLKDIEVETLDGVSYIKVNTKAALDSSQVYMFQFQVKKYFDFEKNKSEFGNYIFNYRYINTRPMRIDKFESFIVLPDGYVVGSILETIPKAKNNNPEFPYELGQIDGKNYIKLKNSKMEIGEHSFMKFRFKPEEKSKILLIFLVIIAIGYLVYFRELINNKNKK
jgi:hypothetical protein